MDDIAGLNSMMHFFIDLMAVVAMFFVGAVALMCAALVSTTWACIGLMIIAFICFALGVVIIATYAARRFRHE